MMKHPDCANNADGQKAAIERQRDNWAPNEALVAPSGAWMRVDAQHYSSPLLSATSQGSQSNG